MSLLSLEVGVAAPLADSQGGRWECSLELPLPPSANNQYTVARGRLVKTTQKRNYALLVAQCVMAKRIAPPPPDGFFELAIDAHLTRRDFASRDADNLVKPVQDAVCDALGIRDVRVVAVMTRKFPSAVGRSCLKVRVTSCDTPTPLPLAP